MSNNCVYYSNKDGKLNKLKVKLGSQLKPISNNVPLIQAPDCLTCKKICTNVLECKKNNANHGKSKRSTN